MGVWLILSVRESTFNVRFWRQKLIPTLKGLKNKKNTDFSKHISVCETRRARKKNNLNISSCLSVWRASFNSGQTTFIKSWKIHMYGVTCQATGIPLMSPVIPDQYAILTRYWCAGAMLGRCWASVKDAGPELNQHCPTVSRVAGSNPALWCIFDGRCR